MPVTSKKLTIICAVKDCIQSVTLSLEPGSPGHFASIPTPGKWLALENPGNSFERYCFCPKHAMQLEGEETYAGKH